MTATTQETLLLDADLDRDLLRIAEIVPETIHIAEDPDHLHEQEVHDDFPLEEMMIGERDPDHPEEMKGIPSFSAFSSRYELLIYDKQKKI